MEQKHFDKKNLIVIAALIGLIALVAVVAGLLKPEINPTLGALAADPTAAPEETAIPESTAVPAEDGAEESSETTQSPAKAFLVVQVAGQMYEPIPLYEEGRYTVTRGDYVNTIAVTPDSVRMHESSCDNQDCVEQGVVSLGNKDQRVLQNMIICLPNEVVLELYTPEELTALLLSMAGYTGEDADE